MLDLGISVFRTKFRIAQFTLREVSLDRSVLELLLNVFKLFIALFSDLLFEGFLLGNGKINLLVCTI